MRKLDVPALALLTEDGGVTAPVDADYTRRATLTAISEQSAPGEDDVRVWFDVPLTSGELRRDFYFDLPLPVYSAIQWQRERPEQAVGTVLMSRALLSDVRDRLLDVDERSLDAHDLAALVWALLLTSESDGEVAFDLMREATVMRFNGGETRLRKSLFRLAEVGWLEVEAQGRVVNVRRGPRAHGEPHEATAEQAAPSLDSFGPRKPIDGETERSVRGR